jgi:DNA-binding transcriptional LysR family regulator
VAFGFQALPNRFALDTQGRQSDVSARPRSVHSLDLAMQIETLQLFCDVVRLRSFSEGARANGLLQASASLAVQRLEKHLGVRLIDRSCRPWKLTAEGQLFYDGCRKLLEHYRAVEAQVRGQRLAAESTVRVAAIYSVNLRDMSRCVQRFSELHPGARIQLEYLHPRRVCERVLHDEVDLGIISFPEGQRGLAVIPWRDEPMVVVCPPQHRLAGQRQVQVRQLADEAFVGFDPDLVIRKKIDAFLRAHGVTVKVVLTFDNVEAVKRAVEAGSGIAILPEPTLQHERQAGTLVAVPFAAVNFVRPLGIVYRRGRKPHPAAQAFVDLLRDGIPT